MATTTPAFHVGQEVTILAHHHWAHDRSRATAKGYPATVTRLGRTLAHAESDRGTVYSFDLVTGVARGDFPYLATTPEREAEHAARVEVSTDLARLGVELYRVRGALSLATLTAIRDLVKAEVGA